MNIVSTTLRFLGKLQSAGRLQRPLAVACLCLGFSHQAAPVCRGQEEQVESNFLTNVRQITFDGRRAGEGYFDRTGTKMVFQSERRPDNPFFQIYTLDFETGDTRLISPGIGKTTCAWIHPDGNQILYASTQSDSQAKQKQVAEFELRQSGKQRRYSWDYDENYDLFVKDQQAGTYQQLTSEKGYDAEASFSPDGKLIAFASNRLAYSRPMSDEDQKLFAVDPSFMMDVYLMNADGSNVRRLTDAIGYDGGPFFSPDGKRICWRRFAKNGVTAEIYSMNVDGTDQQQLTKMNVMSWAPFYHPSGKYLVFTTNRHGFDNFELYVVDTLGQSPPCRITSTAGFDGLASFTPDGKKLTWTSNRNSEKKSQIYLADWDHDRALQVLGLNDQKAAIDVDAANSGKQAARLTNADFRPEDLVRHVDYLCRRDLGGRMTGSAGEKKAISYVAAYMNHLGIQPAGDDDTYFQKFTFPDGAKLRDGNRFSWKSLGDENQSPTVDVQEIVADADQWRPLTFSGNTSVEAADVVFAGYGIVAPKTDKFDEYDSYVHLDVKDKWVLAFRFVPEDVSAELRQHLQFYAGLRKKVFHARQRGAKGLIIVSGPRSQVRNQLVPLVNDFAPSGSSIAAVSVTDELAGQWLAVHGRDLETLQKQLDSGEPQIGFQLKGVKVSATVDVEQVTGVGRNVVGRLQFGESPSQEVIIVGAHIDHLGKNGSASSLARQEERRQVHVGADDNASGVAAMLEIAEYLSAQKGKGDRSFRRDVIFAAWSGEELGLHGSKRFAEDLKTENGSAMTAVAALNMDMVGRLNENLILQGIGSSNDWAKVIEQKNVVVGLPVKLSSDTDLPTDATSFYQVGVPILSAFTGAHQDYHTPRDTPEKLNYPQTARIAKLMGLITRQLSTQADKPKYVRQESKPKVAARGGVRAYLGTVPSYGDDVVGVMLSDTTKGAPAEVAGVRGGDIIIELAGKKIENIYDYTAVIDGLKIGQTTTIAVMRDGKRIEFDIVPQSRK